MAQSINLLTPLATLEALHDSLEGKRSTLRVEPQALLHLLIDHSVMVAALKHSGCSVVEPTPTRPRIRARGT
jgi:hypothetical protein